MRLRFKILILVIFLFVFNRFFFVHTYQKTQNGGTAGGITEGDFRCLSSSLYLCMFEVF